MTGATAGRAAGARSVTRAAGPGPTCRAVRPAVPRGDSAMPLLSNPSFAAKTSLTYITTGALIDVWAGVWYRYLRQQAADSVDTSHWYICWGLLLTGAVLVILGIL